MVKAEDRLMHWLRDAHAAEEQAETMLNGMSRRTQNYPKLKARIDQHIQETTRQAERVRGCIERRGGGTSTIKDTAARMVALGQAMSGMFVGDEVMKGSIASYAFEAMEIASYNILIATARGSRRRGNCARLPGDFARRRGDGGLAEAGHSLAHA
jgi:ferritin-like metal-binding protein YciE